MNWFVNTQSQKNGKRYYPDELVYEYPNVNFLP